MRGVIRPQLTLSDHLKKNRQIAQNINVFYSLAHIAGFQIVSLGLFGGCSLVIVLSCLLK